MVGVTVLVEELVVVVGIPVVVGTGVVVGTLVLQSSATKRKKNTFTIIF